MQYLGGILKGMIKEFKEFAMKGNVIDLAVGVVIGSAFGKIIDSLVKDIIMPPIGLLAGGVDFSHKLVVLKAASVDAPAVTLNYGLFINAIVSFAIIAFSIFLVIKGINKLKKEKPVAPATPPAEQVLLTEIRDILKSK